MDNGKRAEATLARVQNGTDVVGKFVDFLTVSYGSDKAGGFQTPDRPLRTLTTLDRFGLVRWQGGQPTHRMLQVPELKKAMGLGNGFKLGFGTRRDQIRLLGDGVCPPVMRAVIEQVAGASGQTIETAKAAIPKKARLVHAGL